MGFQRISADLDVNHSERLASGGGAFVRDPFSVVTPREGVVAIQGHVVDRRPLHIIVVGLTSE